MLELRMRSFRHLPTTPGRISAMSEVCIFFLPLPPRHSVQIQLVTFLAWKRTRRSNSRPRQIHLILTLITAISTATHLKNYMFGDKLLRSWAFELDHLLVLLQSSQFASGNVGVGFAISLNLPWTPAARARASPTCEYHRKAAILGPFSRAPL